MQVVTVNVIPEFAQVLSHPFLSFSFFVLWLANFNFLVLCLKDSSAVAAASVAFFILLHFIHCNLLGNIISVWFLLFIASLRSLRDLFYLIAQLPDQDRMQAQQ